MTILTISSKGWVVIPAELRQKYKLKPGAKVRMIDYGGVLSLAPAYDDPIQQTAGMLKQKRSLTTALAKQRAQDRIKERARGR
jgi:AbrB family looped-hinge helix DNA binding protein